MPPQLEGYDRDEFLEECQIRQVFGATLLIAKSIQDFLEGKTSLDAVKGESAVHLAKKIQGSISKEQVIESLLWEGGHEETQAFLLHWIQGATDDQVAHFAWAITGSMTLHESQRLTIHLYNDPDKLPTFHTCSHTMDLPTGYGSQAKFNEKLELALSSAQGGMQVA
jgi:hypothetical protein